MSFDEDSVGASDRLGLRGVRMKGEMLTWTEFRHR